MISEKRLEELLETVQLPDSWVKLYGETGQEILRLARLGLNAELTRLRAFEEGREVFRPLAVWARDHGIPALTVTRGQWIHSVNANRCLDALAALPKEHETESNELKGKR